MSVEVKSQAWGVLWEVADLDGRGLKVPVAGELATISTTVYEDAALTTPLDDALFYSDPYGRLPGYVDDGTYTFQVGDADPQQVEAVSGLSLANGARRDTANEFTVGSNTWVTDEAVPAAQNPSYVAPVGELAVEIMGNGVVKIGANELLRDFIDGTPTNFHQSVPDGLYDSNSRRWYMRSLIIAEMGDPSEIRIRRAGPDNEYPVPDAGPGAMTGLENGAGIGFIRWDAFTTPVAGTPGVTTGGSFQTGTAQISCTLAEDAFDGKTGGRLQFFTTPIGSGTLTERLYIEPNGNILIGTTNDGGARLRIIGANAAHVVLQGIAATGQTAKVVEFYNASGAGGLLFDLDASGNMRLPQVDGSLTIGSIGVGSGGAFLAMFEQTSDPGAPAANSARLFVKDNGAGKTQLAVRFASGATQVIATQP
jgi:hypothetical protein